MNTVKFNGLKSVEINGEEHKISRVDVLSENGTTSIRVQLKGQIHSVCGLFKFVNDEGVES